MKKLYAIVVLIFSVFSSEGQVIRVVDSDSGLPIDGVSLSNKEKSIVRYTNENGEVEVAQLLGEDPVFVYHYLYVKQKCHLADVLSKEQLIQLVKNTETLQEVVLSVTRGKEKRNRIGEQIEIITAKEIKKIAPQTSADLLSKTPGVKVQKSQFGGGSPVLRGMEANRVLLVVDGVRLNNAIYRKGHLQNGITVAPSILDRVEILFGPTSVVYGSDALGGVIHYYTKNLRTSAFNQVNSSLYSRVGSVNNEFTTNIATELSFQKWASYTSVSYSTFGDLKMGANRRHGYDDWGKVFEYSNNSEEIANSTPITNTSPELQKNTGYAQVDVLQKIYLPVSNDMELMFNFQYSESSDIPRFDKLTEKTNTGDLKFAEWLYGPQKRMLFSTQLKLEEVHDWIDNGAVTLAFQDIGESRIQRRFNTIDERSYRNENVDVYSLNGDFSVGLTKDKSRNLSYGFEIVYNKVHSNSYGEYLIIDPNTDRITGVSGNFAVQSRYPDGGSDYFTQAVYAEYRQDLNEKNTLNTGLRFTGTQLNATWIDESFIQLPDSKISLKNSALTATIGHVYKPTKSYKISAVFSSGFRSPNIDDVGKVREKGGNITVPNIYLKPEFAYNSEIGVQRYFNNKMFTVGLNVYYTLLDNYIIRAPYDIHNHTEGESTVTYEGETGRVLANVNRDKAYVTGGSFSFRGEFSERWLSRGSITFTEGKTYDTKEYMSSIPPLFGNLGLIYRTHKLELDLNFEFNAEKPAEKYNTSEGIDNIEQSPVRDENASEEVDKYAGTPSWEIFNFSATYDVSPSVELQFKTSNIFDRHYKEFASGISAPGRNFSAAINYLF